MIPMKSPMGAIFDFMASMGFSWGNRPIEGWAAPMPPPVPRSAGKTESVRV
jgi:hypothetical protein